MSGADRVAEVKARINIKDVVARHVDLRERGQNWLGLCPFHNEKTPSFNVRPDQGYYKCFGCGASGDVFSFLQEITGQSFIEVLDTLCEEVGIDVQPRNTDTEKARDEHARLYLLMEEIAKASHAWLIGRSGRTAKAYLRQRGLSAKLVKDFSLGLSLPLSDLFALAKSNSASEDDLEKLGLLSRDMGDLRPFFKQRILFPLRDRRGRTLTFGGRTFLSARSSSPKYINGRQSLLYDKSKALFGLDRALPAWKQGKPAILAEGYLDVIAFSQAQVPGAVASCGTALTLEQLQLIAPSTKRLIVAYDSDKAGLKASRRAALMAIQQGFEVRWARFMRGDAGDYLAEKDLSGLSAVVRDAKPFLELLGEELSPGHDDVQTRVRKLKTCLPFLAAIPDATRKRFWLKHFAQLFDETIDDLKSDVDSFGRAELKRWSAKLGLAKSKASRNAGMLDSQGRQFKNTQKVSSGVGARHNGPPSTGARGPTVAQAKKLMKWSYAERQAFHALLSDSECAAIFCHYFGRGVIPGVNSGGSVDNESNAKPTQTHFVQSIMPIAQKLSSVGSQQTFSTPEEVIGLLSSVRVEKGTPLLRELTRWLRKSDEPATSASDAKVEVDGQTSLQGQPALSGAKESLSNEKRYLMGWIKSYEVDLLKIKAAETLTAIRKLRDAREETGSVQTPADKESLDMLLKKHRSQVSSITKLGEHFESDISTEVVLLKQGDDSQTDDLERTERTEDGVVPSQSSQKGSIDSGQELSLEQSPRESQEREDGSLGEDLLDW